MTTLGRPSVTAVTDLLPHTVRIDAHAVPVPCSLGRAIHRAGTSRDMPRTVASAIRARPALAGLVTAAAIAAAVAAGATWQWRRRAARTRSV